MHTSCVAQEQVLWAARGNCTPESDVSQQPRGTLLYTYLQEILPICPAFLVPRPHLNFATSVYLVNIADTEAGFAAIPPAWRMNGAGDAILLALVYTITSASSLVFVKAAVWQAPGSSG